MAPTTHILCKNIIISVTITRQIKTKEGVWVYCSAPDVAFILVKESSQWRNGNFDSSVIDIVTATHMHISGNGLDAASARLTSRAAQFSCSITDPTRATTCAALNILTIFLLNWLWKWAKESFKIRFPKWRQLCGLTNMKRQNWKKNQYYKCNFMYCTCICSLS